MPAAPIVYTTRSIKRRRSAAHLNGRSHADCGFAYFHTLHIFCRELVVYDDAVLDHTGLTWILLFQTYLEKTVRDQLALEARTYRTDLMSLDPFAGCFHAYALSGIRSRKSHPARVGSPCKRLSPILQDSRCCLKKTQKRVLLASRPSVSAHRSRASHVANLTALYGARFKSRSTGTRSSISGLAIPALDRYSDSVRSCVLSKVRQ